jgi:DNA-binding HxlR family transcriptional regulator
MDGTAHGAGSNAVEEGTPMIQPAKMKDDTIIQASQAICAALSADDDGLKRDVLTHAGNRWSLGIDHTLGVAGRLRHAEIGRRMGGVTHRMLTRTLRQLERDGLIKRIDHGGVLPRVEYELTELGQGLLVHMIPLWTWVIDNADAFRMARDTFVDRQRGAVVPAKGLATISRDTENVVERSR